MGSNVTEIRTSPEDACDLLDMVELLYASRERALMVADLLLSLENVNALGEEDSLNRSKPVNCYPVLHGSVVVVHHRTSPESFYVHVIQGQPWRCQAVDMDVKSRADHIFVSLEDGQEVALRDLSSHTNFSSSFPTSQIQAMLTQIHWLASEGIIKTKSREEVARQFCRTQLLVSALNHHFPPHHEAMMPEDPERKRDPDLCDINWPLQKTHQECKDIWAKAHIVMQSSDFSHIVEQIKQNLKPWGAELHTLYLSAYYALKLQEGQRQQSSQSPSRHNSVNIELDAAGNKADIVSSVVQAKINSGEANNDRLPSNFGCGTDLGHNEQRYSHSAASSSLMERSKKRSRGSASLPSTASTHLLGNNDDDRVNRRSEGRSTQSPNLESRRTSLLEDEAKDASTLSRRFVEGGGVASCKSHAATHHYPLVLSNKESREADEFDYQLGQYLRQKRNYRGHGWLNMSLVAKAGFKVPETLLQLFSGARGYFITRAGYNYLFDFDKCCLRACLDDDVTSSWLTRYQMEIMERRRQGKGK
ncbi:hypothetical protein CEUSTIGMA_g12849.t1 [Chlamydomonas eustigma]|uniref:Uncharacterized protein n=1 Tax=Chlamydomonas eustigma TaxID=1157962 RepID=A0A250XQY6_9CHLO|nr:hypothetical protein CEUSTIGMA_g12849.t1 [Chlamydomonas eustigma]|eukprot:GAX85433.1 hypothetical protein CEUSTIGMA_g12849.t1 [Chlamydomonas eustigma]